MTMGPKRGSRSPKVNTGGEGARVWLSERHAPPAASQSGANGAGVYSSLIICQRISDTQYPWICKYYVFCINDVGRVPVWGHRLKYWILTYKYGRSNSTFFHVLVKILVSYKFISLRVHLDWRTARGSHTDSSLWNHHTHYSVLRLSRGTREPTRYENTTVSGWRTADRKGMRPARHHWHRSQSTVTKTLVS